MGKYFRKTILKTDIDTCWEFFSSPTNLSKMTPKGMSFVIKDFDGKNMYEGQRIGYTLKPLFNIPFFWLTEIRSVKDKREFVDVQLKGPYKIWHHRHLFRETKDGVEMIDMVHYKLYFGILGRLLEKLIVNRKIEHIFNFREKAIQNIF